MNVGECYLNWGCREGLPEGATLEQDLSEQKGQPSWILRRAGQMAGMAWAKAWGWE